MSRYGDIRYVVEITTGCDNWVDGVYHDVDDIDITEHVDNAYDGTRPGDLYNGTVEVLRQRCIDDDLETWLTESIMQTVDLYPNRYAVVYLPRMLCYGYQQTYHEALEMVDDAQRDGDPDRSHWGILDRSTDYMWNA